MDITEYFPIKSQSTIEDKQFLIAIRTLVGDCLNTYTYVEIGSYLGGSLAPFVMDERCQSILSVDDRGLVLADERGGLYDYQHVTSHLMLTNLRNHGLDTSKVTVFDGSMEKLPPQDTSYDLAFIDGEHTDEAVFRDFLYVFDLMKEDCIVMFHDSHLIAKSFLTIQVLLRKHHGSRRYTFFKLANSEMSALFFGKFADVDTTRLFGPGDTEEEMYQRSEKSLLQHKINHRLRFNVVPKLPPGFISRVRSRLWRTVPTRVITEILPPSVQWSAPTPEDKP